MADEKPTLEETTEEVVASSETTSEEVVETTEAQPEQEETVTPEEDTTPTVSPEEFLANFDWQNYEGIEAVEDDKVKEFEQLVSENFVDTQRCRCSCWKVIHDRSRGNHRY